MEVRRLSGFAVHNKGSNYVSGIVIEARYGMKERYQQRRLSCDLLRLSLLQGWRAIVPGDGVSG